MCARTEVLALCPYICSHFSDAKMSSFKVDTFNFEVPLERKALNLKNYLIINLCTKKVNGRQRHKLDVAVATVGIDGVGPGGVLCNSKHSRFGNKFAICLALLKMANAILNCARLHLVAIKGRRCLQSIGSARSEWNEN